MGKLLKTKLCSIVLMYLLKIILPVEITSRAYVQCIYINI